VGVSVSDEIFRENNANGRVEADTIDLHGQFVEEAEEILEERIKYDTIARNDIRRV
jgi:DNA-nicking Smr family endonuclease